MFPKDHIMKNSSLPFFAIGLILLFGCSGESSDPPPNIIVILADDAGYVDFGFMGSEDLETPRLDALAADGVVFTDAHVSATVCAPSRAGLITGRYQQRFGHECNDIPADNGLDLNEQTIGDRMRSAGYKTVAIGKWHLGHGDNYHPNQRGFDEFYGFLAGARSYFHDSSTIDQPGNPRAILHNQQQVPFEGYLTDVFGDQAVEYIDRWKDQPFFMYLAFNAVHTPMDAREDHLEKYAGHPRQTLAAMTWSMDENVGKVIDKLKAENLYENTLIFFLSDNGGATNNQSSSGPLKGWKGNKFEGGHRVPFTLTWPARVKAGGEYGGLTSSLDIFATARTAAGLPVAPDNPSDGVDLIPFISGGKGGAPHEQLYWRKDKMAAARHNDHKLIRLDGYGYRLYNLEDDLGETRDISSENQRKQNELQTGLETWESEMESPRWLENEAWNEVTFEIHQALMENRPPNFVDPGQMARYREGKSGD